MRHVTRRAAVRVLGQNVRPLTALQRQIGNKETPQPSLLTSSIQSRNLSLGTMLSSINPFAKSATDELQNVEDYYDLGEELGSGRFGTVCIGTHKETGEKHAIKSIPKSRVPSIGALQTEIAVLRALDHPNVMKLVDVYEDKYTLNIVTELYTGGEMFDRIVDKGHFSEREAAEAMREILTSLAYCHSQRIAHRDVKPENLLYTTHSEDAPLKLVDLGMAHEFTPGEKMRTTCGSPSYVAPEVLQRSYTEKCDVWSSGVLLYILLCGSTPFYGDTEQAIMRSVSEGKYELDGDIWGQVSDGAKDLLAKMLEMDDSRRISAAGALQHPWLTNTDLSEAPLVGAIENMRQFNTMRKLKAATIKVMATQLSGESDVVELRSLFAKIDGNGDGLVSLAELSAAMLETNGGVAAELNIHTHMDSKEMVDVDEFVALAMRESLYAKESSIAAAFKHFDKDDSGTITKEELAEALGSEAQDLEDMINEADKNGDGVIDYEEFSAVMRAKPVVFQACDVKHERGNNACLSRREEAISSG